MPEQRVLAVGNCNPDHAAIQRMVESGFVAVVERARTLAEARTALEQGRWNLVLVNRIGEYDGAEGLDLVRHVQTLPEADRPPIMLISNYPEAQRAAEQAGAVPGFGKAALGAPATLERLRVFLQPRGEPSVR